MAFVVTETCIKCKYTDCVEVCPVDCFYEGPNFLVIHPDECIDCALCEPECPVDAIYAEDERPEDQQEYLKLNTDSGARIDRIFHPFPESQKLLKDNDVLLDINGYAVGSDGMIAYEGNRVENSVVFDKFQHGEKVPLKILPMTLIP